MLLSENSPSTYQDAISSKIVAPNDLETWALPLREKGKTIATLNGSFDLLHPGHLEMIYQASLQADILCLLLNTDASIKAYKSEKRPINPLKVRQEMIAALAMVDYVTSFAETDPRRALQKIRPDVHVNGSEYGENCLEASVVQENGGRIHVVKLIDGFSSSNLIQKIRESCD